MSAHPIFMSAGFAPEDITIMVAAYEDACRVLRLADRSDPITETVARKIIHCAQTGERDPIRLRDCALQALR